MTDWRVRPFQPGSDEEEWDRLVAGSFNGTFLHSRRFLSYHGDRFVDRSLVVEDGTGSLRAVLPAALDRGDPAVVVSHPGAAFGGLVHDGSLRAARMMSVLEAAADHYRSDGTAVWRYKPVPGIYHRVPSDDDLYGLFRLGARLYRRDLSATIDLETRLPLGASRRKPARAARNRGVKVSWDWSACAEFWPLLGQVLGERHGAVPVHTLDEIEHLASLLPSRVRLITAWLDGEIVAGGVMYCTFPVMHLQYSASSAAGRKVGGSDLVVEAGIEAALEEGYRYYDFGISTEQDGRILNESLQEFKLSFGAGSAVFDHYELTL